MKLAINGATTMPYDLAADLKAAGAAGFTGVEIWWDKLEAYLKEHPPEMLLEELTKSGVQPIGICPFLVSPFRDTDKNREAFQKALAAAAGIKCNLLTICPDFRPAGKTIEEALAEHAEEFAWYAKEAAEQGIRLAIEPIGGHTLVPGPTEALKLIELAGNPDNLGIVLDIFHYMRSGVTAQEILQIPKERLYIVHLNDSQEGMAEELQDKDRLYPYEGCLNIDRYKKLLDQIGYDGYYSVEVFRPEYWEQDMTDINTRAFQSAKKIFKS